jgi:hypothetical protein
MGSPRRSPVGHEGIAVTRGTRRWAGALLASALLVAACADDEPDQIGAGADDPETTEPVEPPEPEEPEDPFAIPDEIDEEYTQRVLDEILPPLWAADREEAEAGPSTMPSDETMAVYRAVFDITVSADQLAYLTGEIATEEALEELREQLDELGDIRWVVQEVGDADETCIPFEFTYEYSDVEETNPGVGALVRPGEHRDPDGINPTPWAVGFAGNPEVIDQSLDTVCAATLEAREEIEQEIEDEAENGDGDGAGAEGEA